MYWGWRSFYLEQDKEYEHNNIDRARMGIDLHDAGWVYEHNTIIRARMANDLHCTNINMTVSFSIHCRIICAL
jgi:hypothetical protein